MDAIATKMHNPQSEWLTLSEVAEWLGVHPSTVRNWADKGHLPSHRTQGGHRRFRRNELDLWSKSQRANASKEEAAQVVQSALGYTRFQISEGHLASQAWYAKLDEGAREEYARSGRKLMQGLNKFLASGEEVGQAEARAMGYDYATLGRRHGLDSLEATRAFLFFRNALQEALLGSYEEAAIRSAQAWGDMARKMDAFTNQVLLSLLETYQALDGSKGK
jgi:excisionase family DNA binding protein